MEVPLIMQIKVFLYKIHSLKKWAKNIRTILSKGEKEGKVNQVIHHWA